MIDFIPVNQPVISSQSKKYVNQALDSGWVSSSGEFVNKFENRFAAYIGVKYGISVSSGTAALHVALLAAGVGSGDEVIVPAFTMAATWLAVLYVGATPVFVDCEIETYNIDPTLIEQKIRKNTKAIIPVHIYGHSSDMDPILRIARKHELIVIEDAAEAHGGTYKGRMCGSMSDISCFSFYGNKIITTGEGGMVLTNSKKYADAAKRFKDLCHSQKKRFIHDGVGFNYRMTNLQAALGCGELKHISKYIRIKRNMAKLYNKLLKDIPGISLPITKSYVTNVYWMYAIVVNKDKYGLDKDSLRTELKKRNIDTRDFFYPPNTQPILKKYLKNKDCFPNTEKISRDGLYIPSGLALTENQIRKVSYAIRKIYLDNNPKLGLNSH